MFALLFSHTAVSTKGSKMQVKFFCFKQIPSLQQERVLARSSLIQLPPEGTQIPFSPPPRSLTFWLDCDDGSHHLHQELCLTDTEKGC